MAVGTATITATSGSISGSTTLTVTSATLSSISVTPANPSIAAGSTQQFAATGTYSDGTSQNITTQVTWSSSNTSVATVNSSGLATSGAVGTATITATATSGSISGSTTLTVTADVYYATNVDVTGLENTWYEGTFGAEFQVGSNSFTVVKLGVFDKDGDGLLNSYVVGIYDTSGNLLASATVPAGTAAPLEQGFRWASLTTPYTLSANTNYVVAAYYPGTGQYDAFYNTATIDPNFTLIQDRWYNNGGALTYPSVSYQNSSTYSYYGPNMAGQIAGQ